MRTISMTGIDPTYRERVPRPKRSAAPGSALLADAHVDPDRAALEPEGFPQSPLQEAAVSGFQKTSREQHERRRSRRRLGGEQDPGLLAAAHRRRCGGNHFFEERVQ